VSPRDRRRFLVALAAGATILALAGAVFAVLHRHDTICPDGRSPVAQRDLGLGQVEYRCHGGRIVTK
jgi:hypothetical protein